MNMLKGLGAAVKRGKQQAMQRVGMSEESHDDEYERSREKVKQCRSTFKDLEKHVKALEANIKALSGTFENIVDTFSEFGAQMDPEGDATEFSGVMVSVVTKLSQQAAEYVQTVGSNTYEIIRSAQERLDHAVEPHSELRQSQLDIDALRHDVRALRALVADANTSAAKAERSKAQLLTLQANLDAHASRHETLARQTKKEMSLATANATTSLWSIYSILFTQTQQHFDDLGGDMRELSGAVNSVKNVGMKSMKEQRSPVLSKPQPLSEVLDTISPPQNRDLFASPLRTDAAISDGAAQAELRLTSLTPVKPPGAAAPASDGAAAGAGAGAPRASPPFAEASVGEMFAGSGDADWEPDWDTHTSPKQPEEEKWGKF